MFQIVSLTRITPMFSSYQDAVSLASLAGASTSRPPEWESGVLFRERAGS